MTTNMMIRKIETFNEVEQMIEELKAEAESIKDSIKEQMTLNDVDEMQVGDYVIRYVDVLSSRFDTKRFKDEMGCDLYKAYTKEISSKRFSIAH